MPDYTPTKQEAEILKKVERLADTMFPHKPFQDVYKFSRCDCKNAMLAAAKFVFQESEGTMRYLKNEAEFQEIQFKGLGITDNIFFEQKVNTAIAMAWEAKKAMRGK